MNDFNLIKYCKSKTLKLMMIFELNHLQLMRKHFIIKCCDIV